jgi:hypothetical protein
MRGAAVFGVMLMATTDYFLDQEGIDWTAALSEWAWLLPGTVTVWLANKFADLFLALEDGSIHVLDAGRGTLSKAATSRDELRRLLDDGDKADDWLMVPLVDRLTSAGMTLGTGQCYGFKMLPVLGGKYAPDNITPMSACAYLAFCGDVHGQIKDLPDGAGIKIEVVE